LGYGGGGWEPNKTSRCAGEGATTERPVKREKTPEGEGKLHPKICMKRRGVQHGEKREKKMEKKGK